MGFHRYHMSLKLRENYNITQTFQHGFKYHSSLADFKKRHTRFSQPHDYLNNLLDF